MVTDEIERFTAKGVLLKSGRKLQADVVVTATGFNLCVFGDIAFSVDDRPIDFAETITYRGTMFTGVPNMAWVFGYYRASWTLRVDLVGYFICRLLRHLDQRDCKSVVPTPRPEQRDMPLSPWVAPEDFSTNYIRRALHLLPKIGDTPEWQHTQDYWQDKDVFPTIDLDDPVFVYQ